MLVFVMNIFKILFIVWILFILIIGNWEILVICWIKWIVIGLMVGLDSLLVWLVKIGFFVFKLMCILSNVLIIEKLFVFFVLIVWVIGIMFVMFGDSLI